MPSAPECPECCPRPDANEAQQVFVSKVIDVADPAQPLVELQQQQKLPPDVDAVKQRLLDRVNALLDNTDELGVGRPAR